jgi:pyruvate/2-oxoglutarate dehydrogenase complex dihydrolipoamide dehydrogenase (E3) component
MYDLVVIGGGAGGLNVATAAAAVGARVALIEKDRLGGECTHTACVPSKALIEATRLVRAVRRAGAFGIRVAEPVVDFPAVMARVRAVVEDFAGGDSGASLEAKGIRVYRGSPRFESFDTVDLGGEKVVGARFVLATGSRPRVPEVPGLAGSGYLDNTTIWGLDALPGTLAILGGGAVGVELGQAFARLGSRVSIVEQAPQLLPGEDEDAARALEDALRAEGVEVYTGADVTGVARRDGLRRIKFRWARDGAMYEVAGDELLVAAGRLANVEGLNLEAIGIEADPVAGVAVDSQLRTHAPNVWAVGDVIGRNRSTHAAEREAAVAFQNAVLHLGKSYDESAIPRCVFTDPEVAAVGETEAEARERHGDDLRVLSAPFAALDRARIDGETAGFARVLATGGGKIRGAVVVGKDASLVLQEFVLAMQAGLGLHEIAETVHAYPTLAAMARKLANQHAASRVEKPYVQTALRWLFGYQPPAARPAPVEG